MTRKEESNGQVRLHRDFCRHMNDNNNDSKHLPDYCFVQLLRKLKYLHSGVLTYHFYLLIYFPIQMNVNKYPFSYFSDPINGSINQIFREVEFWGTLISLQNFTMNIL